MSGGLILISSLLIRTLLGSDLVAILQAGVVRRAVACLFILRAERRKLLSLVKRMLGGLLFCVVISGGFVVMAWAVPMDIPHISFIQSFMGVFSFFAVWG